MRSFAVPIYDINFHGFGSFVATPREEPGIRDARQVQFGTRILLNRSCWPRNKEQSEDRAESFRYA